jgi:5-methyltetrahydrofolate--homocysteine methyltransferase
MSDTLENISQAVIVANLAEIATLTQRALDENIDPQQILDRGLTAGMDHVGAQFREGKMYVPELLRSARTMQISMDVLKPLLTETGAKMAGKAVIGTVHGDLHDIGKNLVGMMLEGAGFQVVDLGKSVEPQAFLEAVKREEPDIVGLSALLTTTMRYMATTISAIEEAGLRDRTKILVGGAPVTEGYAQQIGADAYGSSAPAAVELARKFTGSA